MSYGINVPINISMKLGVHNSYIIVGVNANVEIDKLTWTIGKYTPRKIIILDTGKSILLYFLRNDIPYQFIDIDVQTSFVGSNILDYVSTIDNLTSNVNQHQDLSNIMGGIAVIGAIAVIGVAITKAM